MNSRSRRRSRPSDWARAASISMPGAVHSAEFDRITTHADGAVGVQISQPIGQLRILRGIETFGATGESLVKGVVTTLSAIGLSIKPGGSAQEVTIAGRHRDAWRRHRAARNPWDGRHVAHRQRHLGVKVSACSAPAWWRARSRPHANPDCDKTTTRIRCHSMDWTRSFASAKCREESWTRPYTPFIGHPSRAYMKRFLHILPDP